MKSKIILTCAVLAITLTISGCLTGPPHPGQISIEASCDELVVVTGDPIFRKLSARL
jgi:hypothetical protein